MSLYKYKRVTCVFIDKDKRVYTKKVVVVDGLAVATFNGQTCVYVVGSSTIKHPTFKVGCSRPVTAFPQAAPFISGAYYSMFNTAMMISADRKGRADLVCNAADSRITSLLVCINNSAHQGEFTLVSVSVLKDAKLYDYALERGVVEGDFVVFTKDVVKALENS